MQNTVDIPVWGWTIFGIAVVVMLAIDLLAHRKQHEESRRTAAIWTAIWIGAGLLFNVFVWIVFGDQIAQEYLAAYLTEKSLSMDNLFVFLLIFQILNIPRKHQHEVLFWGIFGALVFRAIFIFAGAAAMERYDWISYVFGGLLLFAAYRTYKEDPNKEQENKIITWLAQHLPISHHSHGGQFIARENGKRVATSLLLALIAIELTDIMFAIDSVAAALSMTRDRFVLYSSNVFAILGLRALYLFLANILEELTYLHYGLAAVLGFTALKLILEDWVHISPLLSVGIICLFIGVSVWASFREKRKVDQLK